MSEMLRAWDQMKAEKEDEVKKRQRLEEKYTELFSVVDNGLVKKGDDGNYQVITDPNEAAEIKEQTSKRKRRQTLNEDYINSLIVEGLDEDSQDVE